MKKLSICFLLIALSTLFLCALATENRDGCKAFGDPCICSNTGGKGFCLPGWMSTTQDQLYCDCSSDVYSEDEIISEMIKKFCQAGSGYFRDRITHSVESRTYSAPILNELFKILGENPADVSGNIKLLPPIPQAFGTGPSFGGFIKNNARDAALKRAQDNATIERNNKRVKELREELKKATRKEKVLSLFFDTDGICQYINQECTCSNTGRKGICAATRTPGGEPPIIKCHCD